MNQRVPAFPDHPKYIIESPELKYRADPGNEGNDRQIGDDEIVPQKYTRVQVMGHRSSFLRVIIHGMIP